MEEPRVSFEPYDPRYLPPGADDRASWDRLWSDVLYDAEHTRRGETDLFLWRTGPFSRTFRQSCHERLPDLHRLGVRRILFGGNGLSCIPDFFAHWGFEVTVSDFSEVAMHDVSTNRAEQRHWDFFFYVARRVEGPVRGVEGTEALGVNWHIVSDEESVQAKILNSYVPGGTLTYEVEDLLDLAPSTPYDAVALFNVLRFCPTEKRLEILRRVYAALRPGGVLMVYDHEWVDEYSEQEEQFRQERTSTGFLSEREDLARWSRSPEGEALENSDATGYWQEHARRTLTNREATLLEASNGRKIVMDFDT